MKTLTKQYGNTLTCVISYRIKHFTDVITHQLCEKSNSIPIFQPTEPFHVVLKSSFIRKIYISPY